MCRKAQKADSELRRVTADLRAFERDYNAAQAELDRGANASTSLAAAKQVSAHVAQQQCALLCSHVYMLYL